MPDKIETMDTAMPHFLPGEPGYEESQKEPEPNPNLKIKERDPEPEKLGVTNEFEESGDPEFDRERRINSGLDQAMMSDTEKAAAQKAGERIDLDLESEFDKADKKHEDEQERDAWFEANPEAHDFVDEFEILELPERLGPLSEQSQFNMSDRLALVKLMRAAATEADPRHRLLLDDVWVLVEEGLNVKEIEAVLGQVGPPSLPAPLLSDYALPGDVNDNELNPLTRATLKKNLEPHNVL